MTHRTKQTDEFSVYEEDADFGEGEVGGGSLLSAPFSGVLQDTTNSLTPSLSKSAQSSIAEASAIAKKLVDVGQKKATEVKNALMVFGNGLMKKINHATMKFANFPEYDVPFNAEFDNGKIISFLTYMYCKQFLL
jgi:hypothetical protein